MIGDQAFEIVDGEIVTRGHILIGRDDHRVVGQLAQRAAVARTEREHGNATCSRRLGGAQHVGRRAARRVNDQQIARLRERFDLAREHVLEAKIIAGGGE